MRGLLGLCLALGLSLVAGSATAKAKHQRAKKHGHKVVQVHHGKAKLAKKHKGKKPGAKKIVIASSARKPVAADVIKDTPYDIKDSGVLELPFQSSITH